MLILRLIKKKIKLLLNIQKYIPRNFTC